jgi:hypothetical protein
MPSNLDSNAPRWKKKEMFDLMLFSVMAWRSLPELHARRPDWAQTVGVAACFEGAVARLAVGKRKVIPIVALLPVH